MSTRPYLAPQIVIPSAQGSPANGASMAGNITSAPTVLSNKSMVSYGASWTGTSPVGTLSVQFSNDYSILPNGVVNNAGTWSTATLNYGGSPVSSVPVTGNIGSAMIDIELTAAYAVRLVYTAASGSGTMQAIINAKVS